MNISPIISKVIFLPLIGLNQAANEVCSLDLPRNLSMSFSSVMISALYFACHLSVEETMSFVL